MTEKLKHSAEDIANWAPVKKVMIATPTNRGLSAEWVASLLNTMASDRVITDKVQIVPFLWPGESLIERARNDIVWHFLNSECTHLFFIDDDIAWEPDCFFDLLAADKELIGGIYPIKTLRWDRLVGLDHPIASEEEAKVLTTEIVVNHADPDHPQNDGPCVVTQDLGTGFMCISRTVFDKMIAEYSDQWYMSNSRGEERRKTWNFFGLMIDMEGTEDATLLSEDYAFCRRWQNLGGVAYVHTDIPVLVHVGKYRYGKYN